MKIVALVGSYRKNGNTARVTVLIEREMKRAAVQDGQTLTFEMIHLGHQDVGLCRGCRVCFDQGEVNCPLKDELLVIKAKMAAADGIVVSSPVYVNDVSGITKNWIDRLAFVSHRPEFAGKCAYLVATVGDGPTNHALKTMKMALNLWGFYVVGQTGFKTGALMKSEEMEARYREKTEKIGQKFYQAIQKRSYTRPSFLSLMTFKIQQLYWQRTAGNSIDYDYWQSQGWTENSREFYIGHEAGRLKVALARMAGALLARYVV